MSISLNHGNNAWKILGYKITAPPSGRGRYGQAFTLTELLVVVGIMGLLLALSGPLISSLKRSGDMGKSSSDIQGLLEQARSYAMANNTYVYAGFQEVDAINPTANNGTGRVSVACVASTTGMRPYTNTPGPLTSNIIPLGKVRYFDNLHITNASSLSTSGKMLRPNADADLSAGGAVTTFQWPITGTATNSFNAMVVEFSPQGTAAIQTNTASLASLPSCIEIALLPTRGNTATASANQAAVQISGITGAVRLYRP